MSVKVIYQITLLGETYELTEEEFKELQPECEEIAQYGKQKSEVIRMAPKKDSLTEFLHSISIKTLVEKSQKTLKTEAIEINAEPIEEAETIKPINVDVIKECLDKPYKPRKDIGLYIKMHEEGADMKTIRDQMLKDDFCPESSLGYHIGKILKASTRVTKIELESVAETADETIKRLKAENQANREKRKQPKIAMK